LALGDRHPHAGQQRRQPLSGHLALEVARGDEPPQLRAIAPKDPDGSAATIRSPLGPAARPALLTVAHCHHRDLQILDQDVLVAQEA